MMQRPTIEATAPPVPDAPPPAPSYASGSGRVRPLQGGFSSTIMTSPTGTASPRVSQQSLLG